MTRALLLSLLFSSTSLLLHAQTPGDWVHSRGNEAMTGLSPTVLKFPLQAAWQFKMMEKPKGQGEMLVSSPVVRGGL